MSERLTNVTRKLNIQPFKGDDSQDVFDWIREYEALTSAQGWDSAEKLRALPACLEENPRRTFHSTQECLPPEQSVDEKWNSITTQFYNHYRPPNALFKYLADFLALKCEPHERIRAFSNRIDAALYRLNQIDSDMAKACHVQRAFKFVHGLPSCYHRHLSPKVQKHSYKKIRRLALELEEGFAAEKGKPIQAVTAAAADAVPSGLPGPALLAGIDAAPTPTGTTPTGNINGNNNKNKLFCKRCRRNNHTYANCRARYTVDGRFLGPKHPKPSDEDMDPNPRPTKKPKRNDAADQEEAEQRIINAISAGIEKAFKKHSKQASKEKDDDPKN